MGLNLNQEFGLILQNVATTARRNMVCTLDINHAENPNDTTVSIHYRYLGDGYEETVNKADLKGSLDAVQRQMEHYMAKDCCGRLFSSGYLKNIDFTIRELSGDNIEIRYNLIKRDITDRETIKQFKVVESTLFHVLDSEKQHSLKPRP